MPGRQIELFECFVDDCVHIWHILELAVEKEVLPDSHFCEEYVDLGAQANEVSNILVVLEQVDLGNAILNVVSDGLTRAGLREAGQHIESCGLARAIVAEQDEDLILVDGQVQIIHDLLSSIQFRQLGDDKPAIFLVAAQGGQFEVPS